MASRAIGILGFDGVSTLELTGSLEAFASANAIANNGTQSPSYQVTIVGLTKKVFHSDTGLVFRAHRSKDTAPRFDTIIVPGGPAACRPEISDFLASWLKERAPETRRIACISSSIFPLAQSGLIDGSVAATQWRFARELAQRFPTLRINYTTSFVGDGHYYTSAGGMMAIEMVLAFVQQDYGAEFASEVARELASRLNPQTDKLEAPEETNYPRDPAERIADLPAWILTHLHQNLTVPDLAARACLCRRHFTRLFRQIFNCTPSDFVEELRINEARARLLGMQTKLDRLAQELGFHNSDTFRRAFERRVGVSPTTFRREMRNGHAAVLPPFQVRPGCAPRAEAC